MTDAFTLRPPAKKQRLRRHACHYLYCRKVAGRKYQARVWLGKKGGGSLNLGLYETECECWRVIKAWLRTSELPPGVLPKYAFRRPDGLFGARVRALGRHWEIGPFEEAAEASTAMIALFARLAFRRPSIKPWKNLVSQLCQRRSL